jgi:hypothetical protein
VEDGHFCMGAALSPVYVDPHAGRASTFERGSMRCPVCQLELGIERRDGEFTLTYNLSDWSKRCPCRDRGGPVLCSNLMPTVLKSLEGEQVFGMAEDVKDEVSTR